MEKVILLKAEEYNWGFKRAGSWEKIVWNIYRDRTYNMKLYSILPFEECKIYRSPDGYNIYDFIGVSQKNGKLSQRKYDCLLSALDSEPWRDSSVECDACDGVAWKIERFSPDGAVVQSSGDLGYIYGQEVLETIAGLLPFVNNYGSCAYINVRRKEEGD